MAPAKMTSDRLAAGPRASRKTLSGAAAASPLTGSPFVTRLMASLSCVDAWSDSSMLNCCVSKDTRHSGSFSMRFSTPSTSATGTQQTSHTAPLPSPPTLPAPEISHLSHAIAGITFTASADVTIRPSNELCRSHAPTRVPSLIGMAMAPSSTLAE